MLWGELEIGQLFLSQLKAKFIWIYYQLGIRLDEISTVSNAKKKSNKPAKLFQIQIGVKTVHQETFQSKKQSYLEFLCHCR